MNKLFISFFLLISFHVSAQKIYYSNANRTDFFDEVIYLTGKQDSNIVVWLYQFKENTLKLYIYGTEMNLLKQSSFKLTTFGRLYTMDFLRKDNGYDLLIQYVSKNNSVTQLFSFNKTKSTIVPAKILSNTETSNGLAVKSSKNGKYTGLIRGFSTPEDSIVVQYAVYDEHNELVKDINFVLPQKHNSIDLAASLLDNTGNFFFTAARDINDTAPEQDITIYEVNLRKDSLLINDIVRTERFSNINIQQNKTTGSLNVSGIWMNDNQKTNKLIHSERKFYF